MLSNRNGNSRPNGHAPNDANRLPAPSLADRLPPQNLECERSVLGSILYDNEVLPKIIDLLQVNDFYRDANQVIYQAMLDQYERGTPEVIDVISLHEELERDHQWENVGGIDYLTEITQSVPHAANALYYAGIVKEKAINRQLIEAATQTISNGHSNQFTAGQLWDQLEAKLTSIKNGGEIQSADEELWLHPLPDRMDAAAFYGPIGEIVQTIAPETEACSEAILIQLLAMLGGAMGSRPHFRIGGTVHHCNLFVCAIGETGQGRKGTSFDAVDWLMKEAYPDWPRPVRGLVSGEGLIEKADKQHGPILVLESEFGGTLGVMKRDGNSLCSVLKQAWDGPYLDVTTKNHSVRCSTAYVNLIAHITYRELARKLNPDDIENGLVNRILFCHSYRARSLPRGGDFKAVKQALDPWVAVIMDAIRFGQQWDVGVPFLRDQPAEAMWEPLYNGPLTALRGGLYGAATVRRPTQVMRLAMILAAVDGSNYILTQHLGAALAVWNYCDRTAAHIWGKPRMEGNLGKLVAFMESATSGMTPKEINRKLFRSQLPRVELERLLSQAQSSGHLVYKLLKTKGRDRHEWVHSKKG